MKFTLIKRIVLSQILILLMTGGYAQKLDSATVKRTYQTAFAKTVLSSLNQLRINLLHNRLPLRYYMIMIIFTFLSGLMIRNPTRSAR